MAEVVVSENNASKRRSVISSLFHKITRSGKCGGTGSGNAVHPSPEAAVGGTKDKKGRNDKNKKKPQQPKKQDLAKKKSSTSDDRGRKSKVAADPTNEGFGVETTEILPNLTKDRPKPPAARRPPGDRRRGGGPVGARGSGGFGQSPGQPNGRVQQQNAGPQEGGLVPDVQPPSSAPPFTPSVRPPKLPDPASKPKNIFASRPRLTLSVSHDDDNDDDLDGLIEEADDEADGGHGGSIKPQLSGEDVEGTQDRGPECRTSKPCSPSSSSISLDDRSIGDSRRFLRTPVAEPGPGDPPSSRAELRPNLLPEATESSSRNSVTNRSFGEDDGQNDHVNVKAMVKRLSFQGEQDLAAGSAPVMTTTPTNYGNCPKTGVRSDGGRPSSDPRPSLLYRKSFPQPSSGENDAQELGPRKSRHSEDFGRKRMSFERDNVRNKHTDVCNNNNRINGDGHRYSTGPHPVNNNNNSSNRNSNNRLSNESAKSLRGGAVIVA